MTDGRIYEEKRQYIASLEKVLYPIQDFGKVYYAHEYGTGAEYIGVYDIIGGAVYIDVTGKGLDGLFKEVAKVVSGQIPDGIVHDTDTKRKIVGLFHKQYTDK